MSRSLQAHRRMAALLLAVSLLFSAAPISVYAGASQEEPKGVTQEAEAPAASEQEAGATESQEGAAPEIATDARPGQGPDETQGTDPVPAGEAREGNPVNRTPAAAPTPQGRSPVNSHQYHMGDVGVINKIIHDNGLGFTEDDIASWNFITWSGTESDTNRRVVRLNISSQSLYGTLDVTGLDALTHLNCRNNSLVGLHVSGLASLTEIVCRDNKLTSLDVGSLVSLASLNSYNNELTKLVNLPASLKTLYCNANPMTTLDVSYLPLLEYLNCASSGLESLNVSGLANLRELHCNGNSLTSLDVSGLPLTTFACQENPLTSLTLQDGRVVTVAISGNGAVRLTGYTHDPVTPQLVFTATAHTLNLFERWECDTNNVSIGDTTSNVLGFAMPAGDVGLTAVFNYVYHPSDMAAINEIIRANGLTAYNEDEPANWDFVTQWSGNANNKRIERINLSSLGLTGTVDVTGLAELNNLWCNNNPNVTELKVSGLEKLTTLYCYYNGLDALDVTNNPALKELRCHNNSLHTLDVSNNPALTYLDCGTNSLAALDVSKNLALTTLRCNSNRLAVLDVSNNSALTTLYCGHNNLAVLDLSNNSALSILSCANNGLTVLDVSENSALRDLYCNGNNLAVLDVSNNSALATLHCDGNSLAELDVSQNSALTNLACENNSLAALDLSNNSALQWLYCENNSLAVLDLSNNSALQRLYCNDNGLAVLDLPKSSALRILECHNNNLTVLDLTGCVRLSTASRFENNPYESLALPGGERLQVQAFPAVGGTVMMTAFNLSSKVVELTAAPASPFDAVVWAGSASGATSVLQFTVSGDMSVTANFRTSGNAQTPYITSQPQGGAYTRNAPATLAVAASVSDGGALAYQWYSNKNDSNAGGTAIAGATGSSYAPPTADTGTTYYYVGITNTNVYATGSQSATIFSNPAAVTVTASDGNGQPGPLTLTGLPDVVRVGDSFTLTPSADAQSGSDGWGWDAAYFDATFNSPATFTALKAGNTTISFTSASGQSVALSLTILEKGSGGTGSVSDANSAVAATGDGSTVWIYITLALAASTAATVCWLARCRRGNAGEAYRK